jgi:hypothetical protein
LTGWPRKESSGRSRIEQYGLGHGIIGAAVAAWPAVALVSSYELLMVIIRGAQQSTHGRTVTAAQLP